MPHHLMERSQGRVGELLAMPPLVAIWRLAIPTTIVMALAAASNVASTWFVSRLGTAAIGAISLVFPLSLLVTTVMAGGIGVGASSAVARACGAGRPGEAGAVAAHALALALGSGLGLALAAWGGVETLFRLMGAGGEVREGAVRVALVLLGGSAITFLAGMFDSVLRGEGNVRLPAICSSGSLLGQIVLTPVLMFGCGLGLVGAPLAMLACQLASLLPRAWWVFGGRSAVRPRFVRSQGWAPLRAILRVGVPAALAASIANLGTMVLTGVLARFGATTLAAYGLALRFDFVLLSFAFGVGAAVLTLVGMAAGARRVDRVRAFVLRGGTVIVALIVVPAIVLVWRPELWLGIFTADPGVHAVGRNYFRVVGPSYPFLGVSMVVAFAFQGLGRASIPTVFLAVRMAGVLATAMVLTGRYGLGTQAVFAAIAAGNVVSAVGMGWLYRRLARRLDASP